MEFLIGIAVLLVEIIAIVDAVKGTLTTDKKVLWIALIVLFPVGGVILYYLLGRSK